MNRVNAQSGFFDNVSAYDQIREVWKAGASEDEVVRLKDELATERDRSLRLLAEFDNYRRRTNEERASAEETGKREILLALLDVMDDFDRALLHVGTAPDAVADGLKLIRQRLSDMLHSNGVTI